MCCLRAFLGGKIRVGRRGVTSIISSSESSVKANSGWKWRLLCVSPSESFADSLFILDVMPSGKVCWGVDNSSRSMGT